MKLLPQLEQAPNLVVADHQGKLFDIPELAMVGRAGEVFVVPDPQELITLPLGSDLFHLPGRKPVGIDRSSGQLVVLDEYYGQKVLAACAFPAPAHTLFYHCAWSRLPGAPKLPLYAYCALGWKDENFVIPAVRIDPDIRQDHDRYNPQVVARRGRALLERYPGNRLVRHLMENCLFTYGCPAARNFALGRWEMPLPTSPGCNSSCFGCISLQPPEQFPASQERIRFVPTVEEIVEIAVPHLEKAPRAVASFGQGCEGEPLTNPKLLEESIRAIRAATARGTINLNTNGSRPEVIARLFDAGLDSIRVSVNSFQPELYHRYYAPRGYSFEDVLESLRVSHRKGKFASINYLVFPGITDTEQEINALLRAAENTQFNMIQWRNLNIDPDEYLRLLVPEPQQRTIPPAPLTRAGKGGLWQMIQLVRERLPRVRFGYFNPSLAHRRANKATSL